MKVFELTYSVNGKRDSLFARAENKQEAFYSFFESSTAGSIAIFAYVALNKGTTFVIESLTQKKVTPYHNN